MRESSAAAVGCRIGGGRLWCARPLMHLARCSPCLSSAFAVPSPHLILCLNPLVINHVHTGAAAGAPGAAPGGGGGPPPAAAGPAVQPLAFSPRGPLAPGSGAPYNEPARAPLGAAPGGYPAPGPAGGIASHGLQQAAPLGLGPRAGIGAAPQQQQQLHQQQHHQQQQQQPAAAPASNEGWTEHTAPDGRKYYYNSVTRVSAWVKPEALMTPEVSCVDGWIIVGSACGRPAPNSCSS